jgi:hypothetical protein
MRLHYRVVLAVLALVVGAALVARYCRVDERQPILVSEGRVVVTNLTGTAWSNVDIWLNDYYRAQARSLAPEQRLEVPLNVFVAGFGQRFDPARQQPEGLELTARGARGEPITLRWGRGRRR